MASPFFDAFCTFHTESREKFVDIRCSPMYKGRPCPECLCLIENHFAYPANLPHSISLPPTVMWDIRTMRVMCKSASVYLNLSFMARYLHYYCLIMIKKVGTNAINA